MPRWAKGEMKFDDPALRERYLDNVYRCGYNGLAAVRTGLHYYTVGRWMKIDGPEQKEFKELLELAHKLHSEEKADRLQREALEGHEEPIYDKDGKKVGTKRKYETPLRLAMLRRHDAAFKDSVDVNHKTDVGVMVMPQPVGSVSEWAQLVKKAKEEADARLAEEKKGRGS